MPMYHVGRNTVAQNVPVSYNQNGFQKAPENFPIDGLPSEIDPLYQTKNIGNHQDIQNLANDGTIVRVKKIYHLQKTQDAPLIPKEPLSPGPETSCDCVNCGKNNMRSPQKQHNDDSCDCHACNPRRFCKCADCRHHDQHIEQQNQRRSVPCPECSQEPMYTKQRINYTNHAQNSYPNEEVFENVRVYPQKQKRETIAPSSQGHNPKKSMCYCSECNAKRNFSLFNKHTKGANNNDDDWTIATENSLKSWYHH